MSEKLESYRVDGEETEEGVTVWLTIAQGDWETTWPLVIELSEDESRSPVSAQISGFSTGLRGMDSTRHDYSGEIRPVEVRPGDSVEDIIQRAWGQVSFVEWQA